MPGDLGISIDDDNLIEKGRHAEVYKGQLADGQFVAVKRLTKILTKHAEILLIGVERSRDERSSRSGQRSG
uniref:Uncharacterized protein n=1 Tax=Triticum urartu TaxID=4572 RepID=A0A8R7VIH8_TRIUA